MYFSGDDGARVSADLLQVMATLGLTRDLGASSEFSLGLRLGVILGGRLDAGGSRHDFDPGFVAALAFDWRALSAPDDPLTLTLGLQLGVSLASLVGTDDDVARSWVATDARLSVTVSRTLWQVLTPYLSVRGFGGAVFWNDTTGGDKTHVQIALGLAIELTEGLSLSVEGALLAERGVFGGLAVAF
jgi:hypothetical protein